MDKHLDDITSDLLAHVRSIKSDKWEVYEWAPYVIVVHTADYKKFFCIQVEYRVVVREYQTKEDVETSFSTLAELRKLLA
jgi:hypothetical protein